jgi:hypothetical protein
MKFRSVKEINPMRQLYPFLSAALLGTLSFLLLPPPIPAQQLAKRLILKDGSYQLASKWEVKGDRVHYLSAERNEWEEVPKSLVDWEATDKYEKDRAAGAPPPEAVDLDKELAAERRADEAKSPHVAPGLRLPDDGGVVLLDTFQNQPQLVELQQSNGQINQDRKGNILRAAINPIASARQPIELAGEHAKIQAHAALPAIYVNVEQPDLGADATTQVQQKEMPWDRFRIVRLQAKQSKRIVGDVKVAVYGKVSQEEKFVPTSATQLTGGWVKLTPGNELAPGEYAVVEMLGKEGMNLYVWDFGVNSSAPANAAALKPDASETTPPTEQPKLQKRPPLPN